MGILHDGAWIADPDLSTIKKGRFIRPESQFRDWISLDGSTQYPVEANRYHLYVSYACPWAHRTLIMRELKCLNDSISVSVVDPLTQDHGWTFGLSSDDTIDSVNHKKFLYEIYQAADSKYSGRVTVPVLWDKQTQTIVNNESSEIIRILNCAFHDICHRKIDFYPEPLREQIDEINSFVYSNVNNGVYKCGFATSQTAYEDAFDHLFQALETLEIRLDKTRYLVDNQMTEADIRLFTTLIRFDAVYVGHFKANKYRIADLPNLSNYLRDMYQTEGIAKTVHMDHIKQHYYMSHTTINPTRIVPKGPELNFSAAHDRAERFS